MKSRCHPASRKVLGSWGESVVDTLFLNFGFEKERENWFFKGGEIDRVYRKDSQWVISEIKTLYLSQTLDWERHLSETFLRPWIKPRQIRNLYRVSEHIRAFQGNQKSSFFIRVCFVFLLPKGKKLSSPPDHLNPGKFFLVSERVGVLSVDVSDIGYRY